MWWLLGIAAAAAFFFAGKPDRPTATGGDATAGLTVGVILALIYGNWWLVTRAITAGTLLGPLFEILPRLARHR
ncbi:hypothetical protein ACQKOH_01345 [Sphingomonas sp. NPDC092331]|jgi:hypothetical protein|uniref:hypothetical protein n=1 Tax=unclassified Sphingomonas TaxID=196159 RepID=UPI0031F5B231